MLKFWIERCLSSKTNLGNWARARPLGELSVGKRALSFAICKNFPESAGRQSYEEAMMLERKNGSKSPLERISSETRIFFLQTIMALEHGKLTSPSRLTLHTRLSSCRQCLGVLVMLGTHGREALAGASFPDFSFVQWRAQKEQGCVLISALCSESEGEAGTPWSVIWLPLLSSCCGHGCIHPPAQETGPGDAPASWAVFRNRDLCVPIMLEENMGCTEMWPAPWQMRAWRLWI